MEFQAKAASQFQAWEDEIANLQAGTERAHREYAAVETSLRTLRDRQKQLGTNMRQAQDRSGAFQREGLLLQQEKERLQKQLKDERSALEALANDLHNEMANDNQHKLQFCKEMEALNQELSNLLMQQEELRLQKFVTFQSVQDLRAYLIDNETSKAGKDASDATSNHQCFTLSQLDDALAIFEDAHQQYQTSQTQLEQLEKQVQALREQFQERGQKAGQSFTSESLIDLERAWVETEDAATEAPAHVQLFYSGSLAAETDDEESASAVTSTSLPQTHTKSDASTATTET